MSDAGGIKAVDVAKSSKKNYVTKAPKKITGSTVKPLDWLTEYKDPIRFNDEKELEELFYEISKQRHVSDIVIRPDSPICLKIKGEGLKAISHRVMDLIEAEQLVKILTTNDSIFGEIRNGNPVSGLAKVLENDEDGSAKYSSLGTRVKARYRYEVTACASAKNEDAFSAIIRPLPIDPIKYDKLGMSEEFVNMCIVNDGIVLFAGATGEGKSTSLSSIIRYIAENDTIIKGILLTHEDPIEVSYDNIESIHSIIIQSSIGPGQHVGSFDAANRSAMRRSPDLVLVGELRDGPTVESAVELSLTGHPVFATTHANNVSAILPRLISRFAQEIQGQKAYDIIDTVRVLVAQKLIKNTNDEIFAVREVLRFTPELRQYLKPFTVTPDLLYKKIDAIMASGMLGSLSYERQGRELLAKGIIDNENYRKLVEDSDAFDEDTLEQLNALL